MAAGPPLFTSPRSPRKHVRGAAARGYDPLARPSSSRGAHMMYPSQPITAWSSRYTVTRIWGETPESHDPEITIKITRRRNGDCLYIAGRPMNAGHQQPASDSSAVLGDVRFLTQLLEEFLLRTEPGGASYIFVQARKISRKPKSRMEAEVGGGLGRRSGPCLANPGLPREPRTDVGESAEDVAATAGPGRLVRPDSAAQRSVHNLFKAISTGHATTRALTTRALTTRAA